MHICHAPGDMANVQLTEQCICTAQQGMLLGFVLHPDAAFHMWHMPSGASHKLMSVVQMLHNLACFLDSGHQGK